MAGYPVTVRGTEQPIADDLGVAVAGSDLPRGTVHLPAWQRAGHTTRGGTAA